MLDSHPASYHYGHRCQDIENLASLACVMYHAEYHNLNDHKGNKKQKMHLQERLLLAPRRRFVIKTVVCNYVSQSLLDHSWITDRG